MTELPKPPRRAHEVVIRAGANTLEQLRRYLCELYGTSGEDLSLPHGGIHDSRGYATVAYSRDDSITPEVFASAMDLYNASLRPSQAGVLSDLLATPPPETVYLLGKGASLDEWAKDLPYSIEGSLVHTEEDEPITSAVMKVLALPDGVQIWATNETAEKYPCTHAIYVDHIYGDCEIPEHVIPIRPNYRHHDHDGRGYTFRWLEMEQEAGEWRQIGDLDIKYSLATSAVALILLGMWGVQQVIMVGFGRMCPSDMLSGLGKRFEGQRKGNRNNLDYSEVNEMTRYAREQSGIPSVLLYHRDNQPLREAFAEIEGDRRDIDALLSLRPDSEESGPRIENP